MSVLGKARAEVLSPHWLRELPSLSDFTPKTNAIYSLSTTELPPTVLNLYTHSRSRALGLAAAADFLVEGELPCRPPPSPPLPHRPIPSSPPYQSSLGLLSVHGRCSCSSAMTGRSRGSSTTTDCRMSWTRTPRSWLDNIPTGPRRAGAHPQCTSYSVYSK
jgi:hypothetical protein